MNEEHLAIVKEVHRKEAERMRAIGEPELEGPPIPYTELPALPPESGYYREWDTYRREVAKLLAAGFEGSWILIKGDTIDGAYASWKLAYLVGIEKLRQKQLEGPFLIQRIRSAEPRSTLQRLGRSCPLSPSPLKKTA